MRKFIRKYKWFIIGALDMLAICVVGLHVLTTGTGWWLFAIWLYLQFFLANMGLTESWNDIWNVAMYWRVCPNCHWIGARPDCVRYKHDDEVGPLLCPDCYEITEGLHARPPRR